MIRVLLGILCLISTNPAADAEEFMLRDTLPHRRAALYAIEGKPIPTEFWPSKWNRETPATGGSLEGHATLLVTYSSWLPESRQALEIAKNAVEEFGTQNVKVLAIHHGVILGKSIAPVDPEIPIGWDENGKLRRYLMADADPNFYLFDRTGKLVYADLSTVDLRLALMAAINSKAIAAASTDEPGNTSRSENYLETWGIYDAESRQKVSLSLPSGRGANASDAIFVAPPVGQSGDRVRHQVSELFSSDHQLVVRAQNPGPVYSDRVISALIDREQGLGVGAILEAASTRTGKKRRQSVVLLQRLSAKTPLDEPLQGWLEGPTRMDFRVRGIGDGSRLPRSYSWLFDPAAPAGVHDLELPDVLPYDDVLWPPENDFSSREFWASVNDIQGRKPFVDLSQATGYQNAEAPPLFVPGKITVLLATSHPDSKLLSSRGRETNRLITLLTKYSDYVHLLTYLGDQAVPRVGRIVPEAYRHTVILDPPNTFLKMQKLDGRVGPLVYIFSSDRIVRWVGRHDGRNPTSPEIVTLLSTLLADPAVQYRRFGTLLDETLASKWENASPESVRIAAEFDDPVHPFSELFHANQELELYGETATVGYRILLRVEEPTATGFKANARIVWVTLSPSHPLYGRLGRRHDGYERKIEGELDLESDSVDLKWGDFITKPVAKELAINEPMRLQLNSQTRACTGSSGKIRVLVQPYSMPRSLSAYVYDGNEWRKNE